MMRAAQAAFLAFVLASSGALASSSLPSRSGSSGAPGAATPARPLERPGNPQIEVVLVPPKTPRYGSIYSAVKQRQALETLREFLAPLKLDRKLTVKVDECGGQLRVRYDPKGVVTLCYEYMAMIEDMAPVKIAQIGPLSVDRQLVINGAFTQLALHEVASGVIDILQIPVWGSLDDAADDVAGVLMVNFGEDVALVTLLGSSWVFAQHGFWGTGDFTDVVRASDVQRFYNQLCVAYGAKPSTFAFLVKNSSLPKSRADQCEAAYRKLWTSFETTIMPYVDLGLLKLTMQQDWGARLGIVR